MPNVDTMDWTGPIAAVCLLVAALAVLFFWKGPGAFIFGVPIDDGFTGRLRSTVAEKTSELKLKGLSPDKAQALITEVARHAIGEFFAEEFPGKAYKIKATGWPRVHTIIVDHLAIIEIDLGLEWRGRHRIEPLKIRAQLEDEVWDARPAIRAVLRRGEIPNGLPEGALKTPSPRAGDAGPKTASDGVLTSEKQIKSGLKDKLDARAKPTPGTQRKT